MTGKAKINEDNIGSALVGGTLLVSVVLGAVTALLVSPRFGISLLGGGLLATADLLWIKRGLQAALSMLPANASRFAMMRYLLRLAVMAMLLYVAIVKLKADIFGLIIGLSLLVLNIIVFSIYLSTRKGG